MSSEPEVLFERRGTGGVITLNRSKQLNAVTLVMVREMRRQLDAWRYDPSVTRVVITGAGDRAFSAGGDIRQVYDLGRAGRQEEAVIYWREEYALNKVIKYYPKPYVALLDGIVMGGGVGVSIHGSHRVAGDRFLFAMPEVNIGFFPDVGATWFLPRMPGELGTWCALTGERLRADDAVPSTVATHRVSSSRFPELLEGLCSDVPVDAILAAFSEPPGTGAVAKLSARIDELFAGNTAEQILDNLDRDAKSGSDHAEWAAATAKTIRSRSPTSVKVALAQVRRGAAMSFEDCMRTEFRIVSRIVYGEDFYEGVRSALVDKDNSPRWRPDSLAGVTAADVDRHFAPLSRELELP